MIEMMQIQRRAVFELLDAMDVPQGIRRRQEELAVPCSDGSVYDAHAAFRIRPNQLDLPPIHSLRFSLSGRRGNLRLSGQKHLSISCKSCRVDCTDRLGDAHRLAK